MSCELKYVNKSACLQQKADGRFLKIKDMSLTIIILWKSTWIIRAVSGIIYAVVINIVKLIIKDND